MPSRDEILAAYQAGPGATVALVEAVVTALQQEIADLSAQLEQLKARLNKDSHPVLATSHITRQNSDYRRNSKSLFTHSHIGIQCANGTQANHL